MTNKLPTHAMKEAKQVTRTALFTVFNSRITANWSSESAIIRWRKNYSGKASTISCAGPKVYRAGVWTHRTAGILIIICWFSFNFSFLSFCSLILEKIQMRKNRIECNMYRIKTTKQIIMCKLNQFKMMNG